MLPHALVIAFQFLTRLPLSTTEVLDAEGQRRETGRSLLFYPLVGLVIGLLLYWLALILPVSLLAAALVLTLWVGLTGALHIDGLADSADAWLGGFGDRVRTLEIMKDPRSGPMGVVAIVLVLVLKLAAIDMLIRAGTLWPLIFVPLLARSWILLLFLQTPYVRPGGLGDVLARAMPAARLWDLLALVLVAVVLLVPVRLELSMGLVLMLLAAGWGIRRLMMQRIGGFSGDTAGAGIEIQETVLLVFLALML